jgi:hypothetical protein
MKMKRYIIILITVCGLITASCSADFLETHSTQGVDEGNIFISVDNANIALEGTLKLMYVRGSSQNYSGYETLLIMNEMMGDDVVFSAVGSTSLYKTSYQWSLHRNITSGMMNYCYLYHYRIIANLNLIIANIDDAAGSQSERDRIKGEALTLRAAHYFNLVRLWAQRYDYESGKENTQLGIPLILDLETAETPQPRSTVEAVYDAIYTDLTDAIVLLKTEKARTNKIHPNQSIAHGLLSRVALTMGRWDDAATHSRAARTSEYALDPAIYTEKPGRFHSQANSEWMWGVKRIVAENDGFYTFHCFMGNTDAIVTRQSPKCIYNWLYHKMSDSDIRKACFAATKAIANDPSLFSRPTYNPAKPNDNQVPAYFNNKFMVPERNDPQVDCPYMRVAEMYLNEAEALARLGKNGEAQQVLFELTNFRDPSYVKSTKTGEALLEEILLQRRFELWGEGHRWFDLKRMNLPLDRNLEATLPNGSTEVTNHASSTAQVMEVPAGDKRWQFVFSDNELDNNPNIIQNEL